MIMKKFMALAALMLVATMLTNGVSAQDKKGEQDERTEQRADRKAVKRAKHAARKAERARQKAAERAAEAVSFEEAAAAIKAKQFVLEADRVMFRNGQTAYVNSNTNFVLVNLERGTVQVAFNTVQPGPNGIGGVTVDGSVSGLKVNTDKKGDVHADFTIQGIGISAQIFLTLPNGNNRATVDISPNFNSRTLTLNGTLVPLEYSTIYKGRSW